MRLKEQIFVKEKLPESSGWHDTERGRLFWFPKEKEWSCRDDRVSEEYPEWWLKNAPILSLKQEYQILIIRCLEEKFHAIDIETTFSGYDACIEIIRTLQTPELGDLGKEKAFELNEILKLEMNKDD